jgi:Primase C terminal 2 (PriCT-2)
MCVPNTDIVSGGRGGYPISDAPLSEWPDWLLAEAMRKPRKEENPSTSPSSLPPDGVVAELTEALFELDPCEWGSEGSQESYDGWLALMMACKAAGISKEDWLAWCAGDECYADAGDEVGRKWDGVPARLRIPAIVISRSRRW